MNFLRPAKMSRNISASMKTVSVWLQVLIKKKDPMEIFLQAGKIKKRTADKSVYRLPKVRPKNLTFGGRYTRFLSQSLCVSFHINNYLLCTIYFISVILMLFAKFFTSAGITFPTSDCCAFDMPQAIAYLTHSFKG